MILAIDVGNTRVKAAVFKEDSVFELYVFLKFEFQKKTKNILDIHPKITQIVVSSVANLNENDFSGLENYPIHYISHSDKFPFVNQYKTPTTLGIDRMVLAAGASLQYPNQNKLIIDAGTCVTYDYVDSQNVYRGGAISPGLKMRFEALHHFTAKLPLLHQDTNDYFIGTSTQESIQSGVVNGLVYEIDGFIDQYKGLDLNFIIILTGGDTDFLAKRLKNTIFANSNFLIESLNQTFQYQTK